MRRQRLLEDPYRCLTGDGEVAVIRTSAAVPKRYVTARVAPLHLEDDDALEFREVVLDPPRALPKAGTLAAQVKLNNP